MEKEHCWHVGRTTAGQCLQAKGASMSFKQLMIRAETGHFAKHYPVAWLTSDLYWNGVNISSLTCDKPDVRVLVLRDPFERLLSGYDMMAREALAQSTYPKLTERFLPLLGISGPREDSSTIPTPAQFARFVLQTADYTSRTPSWPVRMLSHLMPFTSLWHRQQQNCALQPPESFDMVLRLEEQPRWYSTFLRRLNLTRAAMDPRWSQKRGAAQGCWWAPHGVNCSEVLRFSDSARDNATTRSSENSPRACMLMHADPARSKRQKGAASDANPNPGSVYRPRSGLTGGCERLGDFYADARCGPPRHASCKAIWTTGRFSSRVASG